MRRIALAPLALLFAVPVSAQEQAVSMKNVPPAVMANVRGRFPDAKVEGVAKETDEGTSVYEVTLKQQGRNIDVTTTLAGSLTLIEKEIARKDLPAAVAKLLDEKYPRATIKLVEEVTSVSGPKETLSFYELLLVDAKKQTLEVQLAPDGAKVIKVEKKKPGEVN